MNIIKENLNDFRKFWQDAPFLAGMIVYSFFLSIYWTSIKQFIGDNTLVIRILLLFIIPSMLWIYQLKQISKRKRIRILTFRESKILPQSYIDQLKTILPNSQINLFEKVFLPTLSAAYQAFNEIGQVAYFHAKYYELCSAINKLKSNSALYTHQSSYQGRDIAITAFTFYRILFNKVMEDYLNFLTPKEKGAVNVDVYLLIKRVPEKLTQLLGAQYWRLFEFFEAVYGDISQLKLNEDIKSQLALVFGNAQQESEQSKKQQQKETINHFIQWLEKSIQSNQPKFQLNTGNMIFVSPLKYGNDAVFVTERLFNEYYRAHKIDPEILKQALLSEDVLSDQHYCLKRSNNDEPILFKLSPATYTKSVHEIVHIEMVSQTNLSEEGI